MCAKLKLRLDNVDGNKYVKIPISLEFNVSGQDEVVERDFVDVECEKAVNPIVDYEKVRFLPLNTYSEEITSLTINLRFLDENGDLLPVTNYGDIGFVDNDIKYRKSKFLESFLRLNFYDSDITTDQNLISQTTIYSKITNDDIVGLSEANTGGGLPLNANKFPVRFILTNPITNPKGFSEGFYLYHFKSEVVKDSPMPKYLYMRAEFNNAATGETSRFITTTDILPIDLLMSNLHVRYLLTRTSSGYYYKIDNTYNSATNISESGSAVTLNLYEIRVE